MAEEKPHKYNVVPVGGIFLLFVGIVLLLQFTGVLHWELWGALWKFWPVLIIIFGLGILLQRVNVWLVSILSLAILGVCLGIAVWQTSPSLSGDMRRVGESYSVPLGNIRNVNAGIEISAGSLIVENLRGSSIQNLFEAIATHDGSKYRSSEQRTTMVYDFTQDGTDGNLSLKPINQQYWDKWDVGWRVAFNPQAPVNLDIRVDASCTAIDLADLNIDKLQLVMNASNGNLVLPVSAGECAINIDTDVSNLEIRVPEGLAVKIEAENNLSILEIDKDRFPRQGNYYISPGYDSAPNRVLLNILCDVGRVTVR